VVTTHGWGAQKANEPERIKSYSNVSKGYMRKAIRFTVALEYGRLCESEVKAAD
jgi:hypothetical protein